MFRSIQYPVLNSLSLLMILGGGVAGSLRAEQLPQSPGTVGAASIKETETPEPKVTQWLKDFQSTDKAKQLAATNGLFARGGTAAFRTLVTFRKSKDADLAMRTLVLLKKIDVRAKMKMMHARRLNFQWTQKNLTVENLQKVHDAQMDLAKYTPRVGLRRSTTTYIVYLRGQMFRVKAALRDLAILDQKLKTKPMPTGVVLSILQDARSKKLIVCKRTTEALMAIDAGLLASSAKGRMYPGLLVARARILNMMPKKKKEVEFVCKKILMDCPESFETRDAYEMLIGLYEAQDRLSDLLNILKAYHKAYSKDEDAQRVLADSLEVLFDVYPQFKSAAVLAEYMVKNIPPSRLDLTVVRTYGVCNEYVMKDFAKAEEGYRLLLDLFPDQLITKSLNDALARVKKKAAGTFPKAPDPKNKGPEGVLANIIAALIKQDEDALETLILIDDVDYVLLSIEDVTKTAVLSDYVIDNVVMDEKKGEAVLHVRHFVPTHTVALKETIQFKKEEGVWRMHWPDPDFDDEPIIKIVPPPAPTKKPVKPSK